MKSANGAVNDTPSEIASPAWSGAAADLLARAGGLVGASLDVSETLDALLDLLVPAVADGAVVRLGELAHGAVEQSALQAIPTLQADLSAYLQRYPAFVPADSRLSRTAASGRTTVRNTIDDAWFAEVMPEGERRAAARALGLTAYAAVPLRVRGVTIGAMSLMHTHADRRFSDPDVRLIEELADRAAVAVDHARLFRAEHAARARVELLQALTGKLADADTVEAVARIALGDGLAALGASVGLVATASHDGSKLEVIAHRGHSPGSMDSWPVVPLDPAIPIADAFLRREPVFISDPADRAARYPGFSTFAERAGYASGASIPLLAHGRAYGALAVAFAERHAFEADDRSLVLGIAGQCAAALARIEALRALRASEARYRGLFESDLVGIAFWSGSYLEELNGPFRTMLGFGPAESIGRIAWAEVTPAEYAEADRRAFAQVTDKGRVLPYRKDFIRRDGTRVPVLVGGGLADDGATGVLFALDLSDALRAEAEHRQWADAFEHTSHAVGLTNAQTNRIIVVNRAYAQLFGYEPEELAGRPVSILYPEDGASALRNNIEQIEALGHVSFESTYRRKDGSSFPGAVDATLVRAPDGTPQYRIVNLEDRTERHRFETEIRQAQKMEAVGRLAGGVAHEINNALQGVLGFTAFALRALDADHPAYADVEQAARSGERARDIAHQLLAFSRRQMLKPEAIDVPRVVAEFGMMLKQAIGRERELVADRSGSAVTVFADRGQLEQVLLNLVLNARDATAANGRIAILLDDVIVTNDMLSNDADLRAARVMPGRYVRLRVRDNGRGMDEATRSRVFEPFFTTKAIGEGTGLGLAVVHGIVEQSGGRVWCESVVGEGTAFTVMLPELVSRAPSGAPPIVRGKRALRGAERVLVVDDEAHVRRYVRRELESFGYAVLEAADGRGALDLLATASGDASRPGGTPVDLIVTDLVMSRLGGRELGEEISRRWPGVCVLYTSGYPGEEVVRQGWLAEGAAFLQKPFSGTRLAECARELLDFRAPAS